MSAVQILRKKQFQIVQEMIQLLSINILDRMISKYLDSLRRLHFYLLFFCSLVCLTQSYNLTFEQFLNDKPTTFGLLTVTHARNGNYEYFKKHLSSYAEMDCPLLTEISVAWNNDVTPESAGFVQDPKWKIPVFFIQTPFNAMDFRYLLPPQSKAKVFFNIDDDIITTCQQLAKSFQVWKQISIGDISPILSYGPRGFDFNSTTNTYLYNDPLKAKFHSMSLVGVAWIPRIFLELYYSEKSWQIKQMRKIIKEKNNCDDIGLNFIANYFFPELVPTFLTGNLKYAIHPSSQALTKNHYPFRSQCLKQFSQIFGYNPLRLINIYDRGNPHKFVSQAQKYVVYMRKKQISEKFIEKQSNYALISNDLVENWGSKLETQTLKPENTKKVEKKKDFEDEQNIKMQLQIVKSQYTNEIIEIKKKSEQFRQLVEEEKQKNAKKERKSENQIKTESILNLKSTLSKVAILGVFLSIFILCMFIYLVCDQKQFCNRQETQQLQEEEQQL